MSDGKNRKLQQFRLPQDICAWLKKKADKSGRTKTSIVEEALRKLLCIKQQGTTRG